MAGDWIKIDHNLPEKPETIGIALSLGIDEDAVCGKLIRVWRWADLNTENGFVPHVNLSFIDSLARLNGFGNAMVKVGWLSEKDDGVAFPKFKQNNGKSAKKRLSEAIKKRNQRSRDKDGTNVPISTGQKGDTTRAVSSLLFSNTNSSFNSSSEGESEGKFNPLDPPSYDEAKLQPIWKSMLDVWSKASGTQRNDRFNYKRISGLREAIITNGQASTLLAWEWFCTSPRAENARNGSGGSWIDTFLNHFDKYVSSAASKDAFAPITRTEAKPAQTKGVDDLFFEKLRKQTGKDGKQ